ncbi:MAG: alpha-amylase family glycosyl hydrolase [Candidatus Zixiibacteriota bacterium]
MPDFEQRLRDYFPFGLPVSGACNDWLNLRSILNDATLVANPTDTQLVRKLAARFNAQCAANAPALNPVSPGQLITAGMIVELLRYVALIYCHQQNPGSIKRGINWTSEKKGAELAVKPARAFVDLFPPRPVVLEQESQSKYLSGKSEIASHQEQVALESIMLMLAMINPAFKPFRPFFDDRQLRGAAPYRDFVDSLATYFETEPPVDEMGVSLFKTLLAPMENAPDSLEGQLEFIRAHWAKLLPASLLEKILRITDVLREERYGRGFSQGSTEVLRFGKIAKLDLGYPEIEAFSHDADWMSNVVLIAKSTYVWLDQLAKKYQRPISHLNDIPDEELDRLARWGFTGLWLIGVWERSRASQTIKQIMGNPDAMASAYSLYDYNIAADLGGDSAYENLKDRAWKRGIRLSADMVPNHMGIYSRWMIEHPHWFIQSPYPPFPVYQFTGTNLSDDPRVVLQIEDGYWQHRDAAVVFKRYDTATGDTRFIYHGNDGTNMPWNDTAQLNFLIPEVREAVIQTILHVARKFPIIRFDAAMTLAKRHYQRLWFPQPGDGGAIPSRAEHGMTKEDFDNAFPVEFWREVVDRIKAELPETLLLAEAFWLMEGYFVRTLGMHRVYNSAFMNMLKMEENSKFRQTVKNVLEFSPEVLKRFVNFMNNPDERTAVEQFGKGDKYFGVAAMLVTMPGLPMIGHGQVEGYAEKYGMEYRRAYWDEQADDDMVRRHEAEIFPLMRKRHLFSGAANFAFYDFRTVEGWVDENVFAYSNRAGDERAVVIYNNAFNSTKGWIHTSTAINVASGDNPHLVRKSLSEALGLKVGEGDLYVFRDTRTHLQYVRSGQQIASDGLYAELNGYQYQAFLDWREIYDHDGTWRTLMHRLNGGGVHNIEDVHREMQLEPVLGRLRAILTQENLAAIDKDALAGTFAPLPQTEYLVQAVSQYLGGEIVRLKKVEDKSRLSGKASKEKPSAATKQATANWREYISADRVAVPAAIARVLGEVCNLKRAEDDRDYSAIVFDRLENWRLRKSIVPILAEYHHDEYRGYLDSLLVATLMTSENIVSKVDPVPEWYFDNPYLKRLLAVNVHKDIEWFSKDGWERLIRAYAVSAQLSMRESTRSQNKASAKLFDRAMSLVAAGEESEYQCARLKKLLATATASSGGDIR